VWRGHLSRSKFGFDGWTGGGNRVVTDEINVASDTLQTDCPLGRSVLVNALSPGDSPFT
jgi:hypothetical protein